MQVSWKKGARGDWLTGSNWSGNQAPGAADSVTISAPGTYKITVAYGEVAQAGTVSIANKGTNLDVSGTLDITSALSVSAGTLTLEFDGIVSGGTLSVGSAGRLISNGGTLQAVNLQTAQGSFTLTDVAFDAVSVQGGLTLTAASSFINAFDGLTIQGAAAAAGTLTLAGQYDYLVSSGGLSLQGADGSLGAINLTGATSELDLYGSVSGLGAITLTGNGADLYIAGSHLLDNATLSIGGLGNPTLDIGQSGNGAAGTLTLGSQFAVTQIGTTARFYSVQSADEIINQGSITAGRARSTFTVLGGTFLNAGKIAVSGSETFTFGTAPNVTLINTGTITATGSRTVLNLSSAWTNSGVISIGTGATANLYGADTSLLQLAGGSVAAYNYGITGPTAATVTAAGVLSGYGTISGALNNSGLVAATSGTLTVAGAVSGNGTLRVDHNAVIAISSSASSQTTILFNGTGAKLKVAAPLAFAARVTGLTTSNTIDFLGVIGQSTAQSGGMLTLAAAAGNITFGLSAAEATQRFSYAADGTGGTNLTITAYHVAAPSFSSLVAFGNQHVGGTSQMALTVTNGAVLDGLSERLDATITGNGPVLASGNVMALAAGVSNSTSLLLSLNTSAAGAINGAATLNLVSDGSGIDTLGLASLGSQTVQVTGAVYAYAAATIGAASIDTGIHHVGDQVGSALAITNSGAATGGYTEALDAIFQSMSGAASGQGSVTGLAAQTTNSSSLALSLDTSQSGVVSGTATIGFSSDGTFIDGLGITALAAQSVSITGTIDNYAQLQIGEQNGVGLTGLSNGATLDLGSVAMGGAPLSIGLAVTNSASGLADLLSGNFVLSGNDAGAFTNSGFAAYAGLAAGQSETSQTVSLSTSQAGVFTEIIQFYGTGSNASGYSGDLSTESLTITGTVTASGTQAMPHVAPAGRIQTAGLWLGGMAFLGAAGHHAATEQLRAHAPALDDLAIANWYAGTTTRGPAAAMLPRTAHDTAIGRFELPPHWANPFGNWMPRHE